MRHRHACCATGATSATRPIAAARRADAGADDDRPPAGRVLPRPRRRRARAPSCCASKACRSPAGFSDVSFTRARPARCSGFAGLVGAGRSEVAQALFGLDPQATGRIAVDGQPVAHHAAPARPCALGIGLVPEDRKRQGLVLSMSALEQHDAGDPRRGCRAARSSGARERALAGQDLLRAAARARRRARTRSPPASRAATSRSSCWRKWLAARLPDPDPRRADARRRRRRQGGDPRADRRAGRATAAPCILISSELPEVLQPLHAHPGAARRPDRRRAAARRGDAGGGDAADGGGRGVEVRCSAGCRTVIRRVNPSPSVPAAATAHLEPAIRPNHHPPQLVESFVARRDHHPLRHGEDGDVGHARLTRRGRDSCRSHSRVVAAK